MIRKKENSSIPISDGNLRSMYIEAVRCKSGISMLIDGIIGVTDFSENCIMLSSHGGRINIVGKGLSLCVYESGRVEIVGRIEDIGFCYGKT